MVFVLYFLLSACLTRMRAWITGQQPRKLGIVRSAFVAHSDEPHPLATSIALIQDGQVAVASKHAAPYGRLVVDEYWRAQDGSYILQKTATDLFWYSLCCRDSSYRASIAYFAVRLVGHDVVFSFCRNRWP